VTANATVQIPSGVYARIMEGGVCLLGYHTWDGQPSASSFCGGRAYLHDRVVYTEISIRRAQITVYLWRGLDGEVVICDEKQGGRTVRKMFCIHVSFPRNIRCIHVKEFCEQLDSAF
jgi:hypothetical protein